jgi:hypothetical protein
MPQVLGVDMWPSFTWTTLGMTPRRAGYEHWGTFMPGQHREPNNVFPAEDCAGANRTEAYGGAWGWADANCYSVRMSLCEVAFPSPPPPSPSPPFTAVENFPRFSGGTASPSSTYFWNPDDKTYGDASAQCRQLNGWLVSYGESLTEALAAAGKSAASVVGEGCMMI